AIKEDVFAASELRMKAGADLEKARDPPAQSHAPFSRLCDATQDLKQGTFPRTILSNDSDRLAASHLKAKVPQSPEFLEFVTLHDMPLLEHISCLSGKIPCFSSDHIAECGVSLTAMADEITLRQMLYGYGDIGHGQIASQRPGFVERVLASGAH